MRETRSVRADGGGWPRAPRRAALARASVALLACVMLAGCGQFVGVHESAIALHARPSASPNGENASPIGYVVIRYTVRKIVRRARPVNGVPNPFVICPVQGTIRYADDFGAARTAGGFHLHAGNDIVAPAWSPIVAPFDGVAQATPGGLGGQAVTVRGAQGYVYNAHLYGYGHLGPVKAGTVVGFVGNTGDAAGGPTHDHFEWHPYAVQAPLWVSPYGQSLINGAVDPFPFLQGVC